VADDLQWVVAANEEALRLDTFLAHRLPSLSRREIVELVASGRARLNGHPGKKGTWVHQGDIITAPSAPALAPNPDLPIAVRYVDDAVVVLDKAAGIPSIALRHTETETVANFLVASFSETLTVGPRSLECGLIHRLDTATSGLLLAARTPAAYASLREQFHSRTVEKQYVAVVEGYLRTSGQVTSCLTPSGPRGQFMRTAPTGQEAYTAYVPIATSPSRTLVRLTITTGVRHQIRVHLATLGHPIVGDTHYGSPSGAPRLYLHAEALAFTSPATGQRVRCTSPISQDFAALVKHLQDTGE